jgi:hypothetical protein
MEPTVVVQSERAQPPLHNGDRLTQAEFHRRYEAYPADVKIELVGGLVFFASAADAPHGAAAAALGGVLGAYAAATPGVDGANNVTLILGDKSEPQPDLLLRLLPEYGGRTSCNANGFLAGPPELVAAVAYSAASIELHRKLADYAAAGVQEYLVFILEGMELRWLHLAAKRKLKPDGEGVWRSSVFPGLWIDADALANGDAVRLLTTARRGLATPEHAAFVQQLERRRGG